jgi:UrcA family protein
VKFPNTLTEVIVMSSKFQTLNRAFLVYSTATLLACLLVASNARADEPLPSETVKFQDLNVTTSAGVEKLYHRIHSAARRVCAPPAGWPSQVGSVACAKDAEARAIAKVNLPLLTAYYRTKTGDRSQNIAAN